MGRKRIDLTGKRYGLLTVLKLDHIKGRKRVGYWLCRCDCGNLKVINSNDLRNGSTIACGHLQGGKSKYSIQNKKLYKRWSHIISRCNNPRDISYKNYGARGIKVCKEWLDYENFSKWAIENGNDENLEIDRINVNLGYSPKNCRFVTKLENARNKRNSLKYIYNGQEISLKELADKFNIDYKTLWARLNKSKMSLEKALVYHKEKDI